MRISNPVLLNLAVTAAMLVFVWFSYGWPSMGETLPLPAKLGFVAAFLLLGNPVIENSSLYEQTGGWPARLAAAAVSGGHWYVPMVLLMGVPLPTKEAAIWLVSTAVYIVLNLLLSSRRRHDTATESTSPPKALHSPLAFAVLFWALAVALSLLPILDDTATVLFILILAFSGGAPSPKGADGWNWPDTVLRGLGIAALVFALLAAR